MPRYIDADELIDRAYRERLDNRELIAQMIESAPVVDAEQVKHGHWIWVKHWCDTNRVCSVCGANDLFAITYNIEGKENRHDYCPYCGAKMDGENDD